MSILGCVHQCSNAIMSTDIIEIRYTGYNRLRKMLDSGFVLWKEARKLCGYKDDIVAAEARNALNWLYNYRNGVAHCGVNHAKYCLQVLEEDKQTQKIVQILLVYMYLLVNEHLSVYEGDDSEDCAVCFAELAEVYMTDIDYLVTLTELGHFPTELAREIAIEQNIISVEELNAFVKREELLRVIANNLPDEYRDADPVTRREQALDYLKRVEGNNAYLWN